MKKLLFFCLLSLTIITGCKTQAYYAMGTSETEFKAQNKGHLTVIEQTEYTSIYQKYYTFLGKVNDDEGMYFYFAEGKLVRLDKTGPNVNVVIQHNSN